MQVGKGIERKEKEEKSMNRKTLESWEFWGERGCPWSVVGIHGSLMGVGRCCLS